MQDFYRGKKRASMAVYAHDPSTRKVEAGGLEIQGYPQLCIANSGQPMLHKILP